jgi:hypothetical protein
LLRKLFLVVRRANLPEATIHENCVLRIFGKMFRILRMNNWKTLIIGVRRELV